MDQRDKLIEDANVYLLKRRNSSIINYTNFGKEENFSLMFHKIQKPALFKINAEQQEEYSKTYDKIES